MELQGNFKSEKQTKLFAVNEAIKLRWYWKCCGIKNLFTGVYPPQDLIVNYLLKHGIGQLVTKHDTEWLKLQIDDGKYDCFKNKNISNENQSNATKKKEDISTKMI